jgi:hypothetical protein
MQEEKEDKFKTLMLSLPPPLCEKIRDMNGTPRENYSHIVKYLKRFYIPVCGGENCRYRIRLYGMNIPSPPYPVPRQTHSLCEQSLRDVGVCMNTVSLYEHRVCFRHADIYHPVEYAYHHFHCIPRERDDEVEFRMW